MFRTWLCTTLLLLLLPAKLLSQETHLVAYAGFGGFQAPVWAPKDLGLFDKYGFKGDRYSRARLGAPDPGLYRAAASTSPRSTRRRPSTRSTRAPTWS